MIDRSDTDRNEDARVWLDHLGLGPVANRLNPEDWPVLLGLAEELPQLAGRSWGIARGLSLVLGLPVEVRTGPPRIRLIAEAERSRLGQSTAQLGSSWLLGNARTDAGAGLLLRIGPADRSQAAWLRDEGWIEDDPARPTDKLLVLSECLVPLGLHIAWELVASERPARPWTLGLSQLGLGSRLAPTTTTTLI